MTLRCALHARYSSDQQRAASIEDQFRICREHAAREGWKIAGAYRDAAVSGDSVILRPGVAEIEKKIKAMVAVIEDGGYARGMMERMRVLESRQGELNERLAAVPADIAFVYRRKVERLAEALADPPDRDEAAEAIRGLIKRIVLIPGGKRGVSVSVGSGGRI